MRESGAPATSRDSNRLNVAHIESYSATTRSPNEAPPMGHAYAFILLTDR